jgi:hypothetical protein
MDTFTSKEDEEFFGSLGRLAISWAQVELGLDCAVHIIHAALGGQQIDPEAPRTSLYRKTRYIRKWSRSVPEETFKNAVDILMDEIETASETRHDLIHGVVTKMEEGTGEAEIIRLIHSATKPITQKRLTVTSIDIMRAAVEAGRLARRSLYLGTELQKLPAAIAEVIKKSESELGG